MMRFAIAAATGLALTASAISSASAHDARYSRAGVEAYASAHYGHARHFHPYRAISADRRSVGGDPDPRIRVELRRDSPSGYSW